MDLKGMMTERQKELVEMVENHLRNRTPNAIRSNKRDRGLQAAVKAAHQATGPWAGHVSDEVKEFADLFFETAEKGWQVLAHKARGWGKYERIV